jgi:hypothetical protein
LFPNPGIANVVSEYGSMMVDRPGLYEPGWGDLPDTPGADKNLPGSWRLPWRSGEVIWCGFDHGSIAGRQFGGMGMIDYFRLPKRQWYWYRNAYNHLPPPKWPTPGRASALQLVADKTELSSVDGTDDTQLVVSVLDKNGAALSNCPPVTLSIESGPGEFPTGRDITFAPDTDIPIRDGKAAIEFRSYYAGKTVIRATSPGLKDATVTITSFGQPKYISGVTPAVRPRPYHRFSDIGADGVSNEFGLENPTRVSSELEGFTGRAANDGTAITFWQAKKMDEKPWLRIDLERIVALSAVRVTFPAPGNWSYRIEISQDGEHDWTLFSQSSHQHVKDRWTPQEVTHAPLSGRFVRIQLLEWPADAFAGISEVEASGKTASP